VCDCYQIASACECNNNKKISFIKMTKYILSIRKKFECYD
jgi:hypothetical protein